MGLYNGLYMPPVLRVQPGEAAMESGADGFVLTRAIATDLLPAVESVLACVLD